MFLQGMYQFWASVDSYGVGGKGGVERVGWMWQWMTKINQMM